MKIRIVALAAASLCAQTSERRYSTYVYDVNGQRVETRGSVMTASPQGSASVTTVASINGGAVPSESVQERVISEGPLGRIVERILRLHDQNGRPGTAIKTRIEENRLPDGSLSIRTSVYESDLNGRFALQRRVSAHTRDGKTASTTETVVEQPDISGGWRTVEKRRMTRREEDNRSSAEETIFRADENGNFRPVARQSIQSVRRDGEVLETVQDFNTAVSGAMQLVGQKISRVIRNSDGSEIQVVDVYGMASQGRTVEGYSQGPQLRERQVIERRPGPDSSLVETFSVQRAAVSGRGELGPLVKVSERVCTGDCLDKPNK